MTTDLVVALNGEIAGVVTHDFGRPQFAYTDDYAHTVHTPLSLSLPLRAGHLYPHRTTAPWLAGLLPDDPRVRERWAREFDVSPQNSSALLQHLGRDCAGSVQLAPVHAIGDLLNQTAGHLQPVTDTDIGARLRQLHTASDHWTRDQDRWSLAGAQSKFTAAATADGGWAWTHGNAASTHIIKPGITRFHAQALNEHLCQRAFGLIGIHAAHTAYHEFDGAPAIVVQRYDRITNPDGTVVRIHQEDMCQALGTWPHKKYAADGGPSAIAIAHLLSRHATQDDVDRFTDAVIAQYLAGAPDAHAKNYSVILAGDRVALAPVYDVASVLPYNPDPNSGLARVAMPIAGHSRFGDVDLHHVEKFAAAAGTDPDRLVQRTRQMAAELPDAITTAAADIPAETLGPLADQLRDGIASHCTTVDRPHTGSRRRRAPEPEPDVAPETQPDLEDTIPVVGHSRGGHPISQHRRRRPSMSGGG